MQNNLNKFINWLVTLIFTVIFLFSFIYSTNVYYKDNNILSVFFMFLVLTIWGVIYWLLYKKLKILRKKQEMLFLMLYFIIVSVIQFIVLKQLSVEPNWDFGVVFNSAKGMAATGIRSFVGYPEYFQYFPNNILLFTLSTLFIKIGYILQLDALYSDYVMNILFIDLSLFILYLTIRKLYNNKTAVFGLILSFFFIAIFLYTPIIYSDTMSLFIPILFVFLYSFVKKKEINVKNNWIIFLLMGLLMFVGKEMKVTSLIVFIAIIFDYFICNLKLSNFLNLAICFLIFLGAELVFKIGIVNNDKFNFKINEFGSIPLTHWIMMGVEDSSKDNSGRNTYGGYNENDYKLTESFENSKEAAKFNVQEYKNRVKQMGVLGYSNYLIRKSINTWTDGYYYSNIKLSLKPKHANSFLYNFLIIDEHSRDIMRSYVKGVQYAFIIIIIIGSICKFNKNFKFNYLKLSLIGLFIFFLFWENRSRYIFNYIPIFILIIVDFYDNLKWKVDDKKCLKKKNS